MNWGGLGLDGGGCLPGTAAPGVGFTTGFGTGTDFATGTGLGLPAAGAGLTAPEAGLATAGLDGAAPDDFPIIAVVEVAVGAAGRGAGRLGA